jgi:hypothetical protein
MISPLGVDRYTRTSTTSGSVGWSHETAMPPTWRERDGRGHCRARLLPVGAHVRDHREVLPGGRLPPTRAARRIRNLHAPRARHAALDDTALAAVGPVDAAIDLDEAGRGVGRQARGQRCAGEVREQPVQRGAAHEQRDAPGPQRVAGPGVDHRDAASPRRLAAVVDVHVHRFDQVGRGVVPRRHDVQPLGLERVAHAGEGGERGGLHQYVPSPSNCSRWIHASSIALDLGPNSCSNSAMASLALSGR